MEKRGGTAMIPKERNRLNQLPVDPATYALRNVVERCFIKLKNAQRLATRHNNTAGSYPGFIYFVSIHLWMRQFVSASQKHKRSLVLHHPVPTLATQMEARFYKRVLPSVADGQLGAICRLRIEDQHLPAERRLFPGRLQHGSSVAD